MFLSIVSFLVIYVFRGMLETAEIEASTTIISQFFKSWVGSTSHGASASKTSIKIVRKAINRRIRSRLCKGRVSSHLSVNRGRGRERVSGTSEERCPREIRSGNGKPIGLPCLSASYSGFSDLAG